MPLLPLEPFVYPDDLLQDSGPTLDPSGCWWVAHTKPRAEKALARRLMTQGIRFFLPLYKRQWHNRNRLHCAHLPLFPGYAFFHGDFQTRLEILRTNLVVQTLTVTNQPELHRDLTRVYNLMASEAPLTPEQRLEPGAQVEIIAGPLFGLQGKVLRRGKRLRFLVEIQFLQQGVSVEVESWMIRPVDQGVDVTTSTCA
jgi:transcriptional antiterminator RfaH